ncbi:myelin-associated glycoprotein-like [Trematomus bernacchii]|uniref:myelin-associated glycoprotein-like n=1 Tax=Trematomus bernacchii TaxID=40690 RepID=UPI00146C61E0|nr:myelin-associated glycoprotein-like [Trematomus bernacchii]XP_033975689.1 myelin-associated glycoprotein-like [Trematomus bernacchii]
MTGALKVFLLLLQGSLCFRWEITMPRRIEGLTGSCVKVPCTFDVDSQFDVDLDDSCKAIWIRGSPFGTVVFDSSLTGAQASGNILQGNLTGNLQNKECTTIFYNMPPSHSDYNYYFRIQCDNRLKVTFPTGVRITTQNALDQPTITPSTLEVEEGALVTLSCTAVAPCPILPPDLTWTPRIGDIEEKHESESMVSVMNFTSSYLHNGQHFSCTALYKRQAGNTDRRFEKFMTLHVLYPPTNTSVSYSATVKEGSLVNLTCNGNANPAMYTWYKVNGGHVTDVGSEKMFSTTVSEVDRQFYCKVSNRYGTENSSITQIDVQFPPKETTIIIEPKGPLLEGSSVSLLCKSRANPPVTNYTWYKGDEEEKDVGSILILNNVKPSNSGDYYCIAKNEHGDQNSTLIRLDIQSTNIAKGGKVTQSSVAWNGVPERAIDGNDASIYGKGSCTHTSLQNKPWWRLDLLKRYKINTVTITNRGDCCHERINDAEIHIGNSLNDNGNANPRCAVISSIAAGTSKTFACNGMEGQYVNIVIPGRKGYLTLCEVEVTGQPSGNTATNIAKGGKVTQSSVGWNGVPERAIDGNDASIYGKGSCTHTSLQNKPWWRLDLLKRYTINTVTITNRGDCCHERINGAEIHVGNSLNDNGNANPRCAVISSIAAGSSTTFVCDGMEGQYVNIVIPGRKGYLTLCEVEVTGTESDADDPIEYACD